ncbi:arylsulfatase b [Plakobranchus ocellatus]|uniref:Arylsulfatase b n=1 Tax=Plakobranchus ocellatus TaxID=259542 RepID=A0AAV4DI17_9GAST|nr:arylsulfatase b [Plakobranchus ocellatus]
MDIIVKVARINVSERECPGYQIKSSKVHKFSIALRGPESREKHWGSNSYKVMATGNPSLPILDLPNTERMPKMFGCLMWPWTLSSSLTCLISGSHIDMVHSMLDRLAAYNKIAVPPTYLESDSQYDPKHLGSFWGPWL